MSNFINLDASRMQQNTQTSQSTQIQEPAKSDVDIFTATLNESPNKNSTHLQTENFKRENQAVSLSERSFSIKQNENANRNTLERSFSPEQGSITGGQNPFAQMTNPLDSLFGNTMIAKNVAQVPNQNMASMNEKLVETILVSQPDADNQEVRITLSKGVLPDTEVRIMRDIHGTLNITLQTSNASSFQTLVAGQHDLKAMLAENEGDIKITVESSDAEQNDTNQRSRTYTGYNTEEE